MATSVEMPELGESVTEGTITTWLKEVGDEVEVDEPLLEVSTDKVDTEIPSPVAGTLLEILAEVDDTVDVGAVIAKIGDSDEAGSDDSGDSGDEPEEEEAEEPKAEEKPEPKKDGKPEKSGGSATDVEMPELGESVTEGTITTWLKEVGDEVEVDEPLLEVSTDKVDTEIPSPVAGTLVEILAEVDDTVDVGAVIAKIGDSDAAPADDSDDSDDSDDDSEGEEAAEKKTEQKEVDEGDKADEQPGQKSEEKAEEPKSEEKAEEPKSEEKPEPKKDEKKKDEPKKAEKKSGNDDVPYVTPLVRKLADKHGIDLTKVEGSGIGGRIRKQDVLKAAKGEGKQPAPAAEEKPASRASTKGVRPELAELRGTTKRVNRIREITAKTTHASLHAAAQLTQVHEADMSGVWELRAEAKQAFQDKHGVKLTFLPFFAKAVVEALVSHPNVNASWNDETKEITYHEKVNLGIAVDTDGGLLSPVIHDAQDMSLPELAKAIVDIADRARNNKLKPNDIAGGTFTITNIGSEGALTDTPILVPPQAAMMGTGAIRKRAVVISEDGHDSIGIREVCLLPLTYDHRLIDGADAGRFMTTIVDRLQVADFREDLEL